MSEESKLNQLFQYQLSHVEIGEFLNEDAFQQFLHLQQKNSVSFGLHAPLYRSGSKYDLVEEVHYPPDQAWDLFEQDIRKMSGCGAEYVLVHFPYFKSAMVDDPFTKIEEGLERLSKLQQKYNMMIICEPKLGYERSSIGVDLLHKFPIEVWEKYNLKLCIDIGDYLIGAQEKAISYIKKWQRFIKVVHLHNVEYQDEKYIWVPIHPSHENNGFHFNVKELILELAKSKAVIFVLEHTPHSNPSTEFVQEGISWVKKLLNI